METRRIEDLIHDILKKEFPSDFGKQKIYASGNRLNFSCPYCGDSKDSHKKRGNFYLSTLSYKCYNGGCGVFKDGYTFLKDFGISKNLDSSERSEILSIIKEGKERRRSVYGDVDISLLFDTDFSKVVISREEFMKKFSLRNVVGSKIESYIRRRNQIPDERFAWEESRKKLYLFNLTKNQEIIGLQTRSMGQDSHASKYYTYKLSGIYEKFYKIEDEVFLNEARKIDPISSVFGISFLSFDRTITIFEGPMDSWLWQNSVGLCSVENKFPFEIDNTQYWYDWDDAGRIKSSQMLSEGFRVFNWKKFLTDHDLPLNKKWDLNDLVNYLRLKKQKVRRFEYYFTEETLDLADFIYA
jgi:hypothetical protein